MFRFLHEQLGDRAWVKPGGDHGCLVVEMYNALVDSETEEKLPREFNFHRGSCGIHSYNNCFCHGNPSS